MANNTNPITSVKLTSNLNMNKNKQQVITSADMFNNVNGPIYGGNIDKLNWRIESSYRSIFDKHGTRWTVKQAGLYKDDGSGEELVLPYSSRFVSGQFDSIPKLDAAVIVSSDSSSHPTISLLGAKIRPVQSILYAGHAVVDIYKTNSRFTEDDESLGLGMVAEGDNSSTTVTGTIDVSDWNAETVRFFEDNGNYYLAIVYRSTDVYSSVPFRLEVYHVDSNGSYTLRGDVNFNLRGFGYSDVRYYTCPNAGSGTKLNENLQIVVSSKFGSYFGITVYNHKQNGQNGHKHTWLRNFTFDGSYLIPCVIQCGPSSFSRVTWKMNNSGVPEIDSGASNRNVNGQTWGAFVDDSTWVLQACSWYDTRYAKDSSADDTWMEMGADLANGFSYSGAVLIPSRAGAVETIGTDSSNYLGHLRLLIVPSLVTNQRFHRFTISGAGRWDGYKANLSGSTYYIDNVTTVPLRCPGVSSTMTLPTTNELWESDDNDSSLWKTRDVYDDGIYTMQGSRVSIGGGWNVLYNYRQGFVSGISYGLFGRVGTLVSEWDTVDDGFFITTNGNTVIWRDSKTQKLRFCSTTSETVYEVDRQMKTLALIADRYVLFNTTDYENCVDIETGEKGHWASDWNDRIIYGIQACFVRSDGTVDLYEKALSSNSKGGFYLTGTAASGIDVAYQKQKTFAPSRLLPYNSYQKFYAGNGIVIAGIVPNGKIDTFFSSGSVAPVYRGSVNGRNIAYNSWDGILDGTSYPSTSSGTALYNIPIVGAKFINSFSGKFGVVMNNTGYSIQYDGVRPVGLYNSTSMVDNIDVFFILQSQYYAVINNYICAVSYSTSNVLNGIEQICNIEGMQFIGAFPSVAYFYSPAAKAIFAFTGDSDLQLFVQSDKITNVYSWLYAPNNEWIYLATNDGIYVMTQNNVFRTTQWEGSSIWKMFSTDKDYSIIENNNGYSYKVAIDKGWDDDRVRVETAYFGPGDMKQAVIDTWYIRLFKGEYGSNYSVDVSSKTLADGKVTQNSMLSVRITPEMWNSDGTCLIRYQPENPLGEGQSLSISSYYPIAFIGYSMKDDSTSMPNIERSEVTFYSDKI